MDKYEGLRAAFSRYETEKGDFVAQNLKLAETFMETLQAFLGVPDSFRNPAEEKEVPYLRLYQIGEGGENVEVESVEQAVRHRNDGTFIFAFGVTLEQTPDTFPKHVVVFDLECEIEDGTARFQILDREIEIAFDGKKAPEIGRVHEEVYALIVSWLENWRIEEPRQKIGFHIVDG